MSDVTPEDLRHFMRGELAHYSTDELAQAISVHTLGVGASAEQLDAGAAVAGVLLRGHLPQAPETSSEEALPGKIFREELIAYAVGDIAVHDVRQNYNKVQRSF